MVDSGNYGGLNLSSHTHNYETRYTVITISEGQLRSAPGNIKKDVTNALKIQVKNYLQATLVPLKIWEKHLIL